MSLAYLITHRLIAGNVLGLSLLFLILFAGLLVSTKLRFFILNPLVAPFLGFVILTTFLFGQEPDIPIAVMLLAGAILAAYIFLEIFLVPLTRAQAGIWAVLSILFLLLHIPDRSVTYLGLSLIFAGLLLVKFVAKDKSRRFKIFSATAAILAIFTASYLTHAYYRWQAQKLMKSIGETARFLLRYEPRPEK